jgi:hypothetical protein
MYIVAGIAIDVNISSSDDLSLISEIIDEATEGLAVPTVYHHRSGAQLLGPRQRATCHLFFHYLVRRVKCGLDMRHPFLFRFLFETCAREPPGHVHHCAAWW